MRYRTRFAIPFALAVLLLSAPRSADGQQASPGAVGMQWSMPITSVTRHAPSWNAIDVGLASGFVAALWIDAAQTRALARNNWQGFYESNPLLGPRPSEGQINTYTAAAAVTTLGIAAALPPRARRWWLAAALAVEAYTVYSTTAHLGVSLRVR